MGVSIMRPRRFGCAAAVLFVFLVFEPASGPALAQEGADEIVARLGSTEIRASDVRAFIHALDPAVRQQAARDPRVLGRLAVTRLALLAEAKEKRWDQRPEVIAQIEQVKAQTILTSYTVAQAMPPASYPSDAELQAAYDQNRSRFVTPRQFHLAQIFLAHAPAGDRKAEEAIQKKAEDLARKAGLKNAVFEDLARKNSELPDAAKNGGDAGWLTEQQVVPEIRTVLTELRTTEVSDAIRSSAGWHIIHLIDSKPSVQQSLNDVREALKQGMRKKKLEENEQAYLAGLLDAKHASINEIALNKALDQAK